MFNIEEVEAAAKEATNRLLSQIKEFGFDRDYIAGFKDGVEFKVYIQREQINCALSCDSLRKWLDSFFIEGGDTMNAFEIEFFNTIKEFAEQHALFMDTQNINTQMRLISEKESHSPNAILFACAEVDTDLEKPDYELLEKVMHSAYGIMVITHTWLDFKYKASLEDVPLLNCSNTAS